MNFEFLTAWVYFAGWRIVRWLPEKFAYLLFDRVADFLSKREGRSVARLKSNLERTQPGITKDELDVLTVKAMRSYMRYWCDTFRFPDWDTARILGSVTLENEHLILDAIKAGRGVIVSAPHSGNWDHAAAYFCSRGIPVVTVVERLKPEALFQKFLNYRTALGMEVLPLDARVIATLAQRLRQGALVALVADRDLSKSGVDVNFFGARARMPAGPAVLAIKTGAPLIATLVSYTENGIHIKFQSVLIPIIGNESDRVSATVQICADYFADGISNHPHDWHMLQRIWTDGDFKDRN